MQGGLTRPLRQDPGACRFYNSMPDCAKEGVMERYDKFYTMERLKRVAGNLIQSVFLKTR